MKNQVKKSLELKRLAFRRYFGYSLKNKKTGKRTFIKGIKPYVSFKIKRGYLTKKQAQKINKYWYHIDRQLARPVTVYRSKSKINLKKAQAYAGQDKKFDKIKVAFIPVTNHNVKVRVNKKGVSVETTNIKTGYIVFEHKKLIKNPTKYIKETVKREHPKAKLFKIRVGYNGIYEIDKARADAARIPSVVIRYMNKYDNKEKTRKGANHHWKNWLHGLNAYYSKNQAGMDKYFTARDKFKKSNRDTRRKVRVKERAKLNADGWEYAEKGSIKRIKR